MGSTPPSGQEATRIPELSTPSWCMHQVSSTSPRPEAPMWTIHTATWLPRQAFCKHQKEGPQGHVTQQNRAASQPTGKALTEAGSKHHVQDLLSEVRARTPKSIGKSRNLQPDLIPGPAGGRGTGVSVRACMWRGGQTETGTSDVKGNIKGTNTMRSHLGEKCKRSQTQTHTGGTTHCQDSGEGEGMGIHV